jgi:hypothetical protein
VTTWGSTTRQILALRDMLVAEGVGMVVIESTGTYWKPFVRHEALWNRVEVRRLRRWPVAAGQ